MYLWLLVAWGSHASKTVIRVIIGQTLREKNGKKTLEDETKLCQLQQYSGQLLCAQFEYGLTLVPPLVLPVLPPVLPLTPPIKRASSSSCLRGSRLFSSSMVPGRISNNSHCLSYSSVKWIEAFNATTQEQMTKLLRRGLILLQPQTGDKIWV